MYCDPSLVPFGALRVAGWDEAAGERVEAVHAIGDHPANGAVLCVCSRSRSLSPPARIEDRTGGAGADGPTPVRWRRRMWFVEQPGGRVLVR